LEADCEIAEEVDAAVQRKMETEHQRMVRGAGEESAGASPNRVAMKRRKIGLKVTGLGTPEACCELRMRV
jgi:hypothetical protein